MNYLGFGHRWKNWVAALWCTASSSYLLNGDPGKRVLHCREVRQGDPLSPMLFLLAMEPLHRLFKKAQDLGLLEKVSSTYDNFKMTLYADGAIVFIKPEEKDLTVTTSILNIFAQASRLTTNLRKTEFFPIRCSQANLSFLT
jgi:hypothetical protein